MKRLPHTYGPENMRVMNYGLNKEFYDRYDPEELLKEVGMTTEQVLADIKKILD